MSRKSQGVVLVLALVLLATGVACGALGSQAPDYPTRDITLIVPLNAGGGYDLTARMLVPFIQKYLPKKVNIVVKNEGAAGGRTGYFEIYDAPADGYTIGFVDPGILAMAQTLGQAGTRDAKKVTYLGRAAYQPFLLVLSAANYKTVAEIKGKPIRVAGTTLNQAGAIAILKALGADPRFVLYNGSNDAILAAARGEVDASALTFATMWTQVNAQQGKIIPVMLASKSRLPQAPDVPTPADLAAAMTDGQIAMAGGQYVAIAPPNLPDGIRTILEDAVQKSMRDADFIAQMNKANYMPNALTAAETTKAASDMLDAYISMKSLFAPAQ